jgi:predicted  nucleic acid-binding Zn-ribbon protein
MIEQGQCQHCAGNYEYEAGSKSEFCPHCGKETICRPAQQQFTAPGVTYRQKSSMKFLPWIIVAVLVVVSGFLGAGLYQERTQRILLESQPAAAKEKLNTQAAQIDQHAQENAEAKRAAVGAELKQRLADDQQAVRDAVAGIYEYERSGQTKVLDFRSDGSVVSYVYSGYHSDQPYAKKTLAWTSSENSISVTDAGLSFRPEGRDLIDAQGNRWIRIH